MSTLLSPGEMIRAGACIGCGSCVAQAERPDVHVRFDGDGHLQPSGPASWLNAASDRFTRTCPFSKGAIDENEIAAGQFPQAPLTDVHLGRLEAAYVGHVAEGEFRTLGSSGGMVSWVAAELLRKGLIDGVAHVVAQPDPQTAGRYFQFRISRSEPEILEGAKSRYYPVEMSEILETIRNVPGRYAIVGIPCFIKAVHLLRREDPVFNERIRFTLGLFCGHMKSANFVKSFAWQLHVPEQTVQRVDYRHKDPSRPANLYNARLTTTSGQVAHRDWWHLADGDWGAGFFMNHACNFCDDVTAETADVSFGDAWVEPYSSDGRGTNVVVVRDRLVYELVEQAIAEERLTLTKVDADFVAQTQAAGFRQRREGLAYRLTWARGRHVTRKRVQPDATTPTRHRKLIYRSRYYISEWSNRLSKLANRFDAPGLYLRWAQMAAAVYHGLAYHDGKWGEIKKRYVQLRGE
ncbi:Coenzyme F420 hydrogenase/dehydrogenase, beta subunit C-terminal domain [Dyadobacter sandarakinus]|uniref:Coenzyme F420 hydrogenase/dehydrogenase, beta subunit C-terminal domain n=1 Tax=Dyadobacter sandarakinus TaxID=2747268 RepID=A0ABX7I2I1_9BACT|nr:Coenzyme F420 hydrogenase/dehydrogenase, beta subunit C-terminal domain [Dyadobacter sandarakinus]QRR00287.1 Coenzyme F420 hydrogenase/dehydrogenase, beta subunit C-terminal domain [Dyadobacter sandarakinus]